MYTHKQCLDGLFLTGGIKHGKESVLATVCSLEWEEDSLSSFLAPIPMWLLHWGEGVDMFSQSNISRALQCTSGSSSVLSFTFGEILYNGLQLTKFKHSHFSCECTDCHSKPEVCEDGTKGYVNGSYFRKMKATLQKEVLYCFHFLYLFI